MVLRRLWVPGEDSLTVGIGPFEAIALEERVKHKAIIIIHGSDLLTSEWSLEKVRICGANHVFFKVCAFPRVRRLPHIQLAGEGQAACLHLREFARFEGAHSEVT